MKKNRIVQKRNNAVRRSNILWRLLSNLTVVAVLLFAFSNYAGAQQTTLSVNGTVSDESAEPLPGVTVVVKNTTNGAVSDFDLGSLK